MRNTVVLLTSSLLFCVIMASSAGAVNLGAISGKDATASSAAESPTVPVAFITGSDRGIGLALTRTSQADCSVIQGRSCLGIPAAVVGRVARAATVRCG